jgi:leucyl aminopeptidase
VTTSRHISHLGNGQAVTQLESELKTICGSAHTWGFPHGTGTCFNVVAEIEGNGPEYELILIGAHLDSTASSETTYAPATDDAPGADDNWSGVAGVLEVARRLRSMADQTPPRRSIRFVLFNAEEDGIVGSRLYADHLKEHEGEPGQPSVVAMIAMDMIGWRNPNLNTPPFNFEIHGVGDEYMKGTTGKEYLEAKSAKALTDQLVATIAYAAGQVAPNLTAQQYPLATQDPMTTRSDHWWFLHHLWPACLVSEDMWPPPIAQKGNPRYHLATDLVQYLDLAYQADIARTVATAAWMIANP